MRQTNVCLNRVLILSFINLTKFVSRGLMQTFVLAKKDANFCARKKSVR